MGVTVTTNLGLIKPDTDEKIKEELPTFAGWADQNADNCDIIDGLLRASTHTYTPTWSAASVNPVLGTGGSIEGKYIRLFPRMVIGHIRIFTGTASFNAGSGQYGLTLPVAVPPEFASFSDSIPLGKAYLHDDSAALTSDLLGAFYSVGLASMYFRIPAGGSWSNTNPFTLTNNDRLSCYFMYPTTAA